MDERLRLLQRKAFSSGDPQDIIRYRLAVSQAIPSGIDFRDDTSQPPSRQKIADLLNFYGVKHIIIDHRPGRPKRDCNWNGHVVVLAPCKLSNLFSVVAQGLSEGPSAWMSMATGNYSVEGGVYYLLVEHYYHGTFRTAAAKTWFSGEIGLEASMQVITILDEMSGRGLFIGPLDQPYKATRRRFIKHIMTYLDEGIDEIIQSHQDSLEDYPDSVRHQAALFFWEILNQYVWGIDDLLNIYRAYLAASDNPSPSQFRKRSRDILIDYGML